MDEIKKKSDESWKDQVEKGKQEASQEEPVGPVEADFKFFVTTLALQASIFLGVMPNPSTNKKEENIPQAKFIVDTLGMLEVKTKGNLDQDEVALLENVLYELRTQYVAKANTSKIS